MNFRTAFNRLVDMVSERERVRNKTQAINSSGSEISTLTRVAIVLRWLGGGSYLDICFAFGVAPGSFYHEDGVLWGTMKLIDECFVIGFPFDDYSELTRISKEFSEFCYGRMTDCVLAIDGWVCRTRQPFDYEAQFPSLYRNRHECFGIVILAGCDAKTKFLMWSCKSTGSTNDVLAWEFCNFKTLLDNGKLPFKFYVIGDEAFVCTNQFLVPWSGRGLDPWKDSFNFHLSAMRQCIERAFALLVQRWGIFWRTLKCSYDKWTLVCTVAAKLHNFCIDMNEGTEKDILERHNDDWEDGDNPTVLVNSDENDISRARPSGNTRINITQYLEAQGYRRPTYAARNSRVPT